MKGSRNYSILQGDEKYCWVTGVRNVPLHKHHVLFGQKFWKTADKNGLWVYLTVEMHEGTNGVHGKNGHALDLRLKREVQKAYEDEYGHEAWMKLIGRNYLDDETEE